MWGPMMAPGWDWGTGVVWWVLMAGGHFIFWAAVIGLTVWLVARITRPERDQKTAADIAEERFARGEITKEQLIEIRGALAAR